LVVVVVVVVPLSPLGPRLAEPGCMNRRCSAGALSPRQTPRPSVAVLCKGKCCPFFRGGSPEAFRDCALRVANRGDMLPVLPRRPGECRETMGFYECARGNAAGFSAAPRGVSGNLWFFTTAQGEMLQIFPRHPVECRETICFYLCARGNAAEFSTAPREV
jgi:hypothetical protein